MGLLHQTVFLKTVVDFEKSVYESQAVGQTSLRSLLGQRNWIKLRWCLLLMTQGVWLMKFKQQRTSLHTLLTTGDQI